MLLPLEHGSQKEYRMAEASEQVAGRIGLKLPLVAVKRVRQAAATGEAAETGGKNAQRDHSVQESQPLPRSYGHGREVQPQPRLRDVGVDHAGNRSDPEQHATSTALSGRRGAM